MRRQITVTALALVLGTNVWSVDSLAGDSQAVETNGYVVVENADWVACDNVKDIVPGSALDFTSIGGVEGPAGKYGRVIVVGDHFELERRPGEKLRFYGVNIGRCMNAQPDKALTVKLVDRLVRQGYNAIRLHSHDDLILVERNGRVVVHEKNMDCLDWLVAQAAKKGMYIITDFLVRRNSWSIPDFRARIYFEEPLFQNYADGIRAWFNHVNPYTGKAYKDEPAMAFVSLVNEGSFYDCWDRIVKRYESTFRQCWKELMGEAPYPTGGEWKLGDGRRVAYSDFVMKAEARFFNKVKRLVREELRSKILLTNFDGVKEVAGSLAVRARNYDYVDTHFYLAHPSFLGKGWGGASHTWMLDALADRRVPQTEAAFIRNPSKPFTVTEWDYCAPNVYRCGAGLLIGAMAACQDWDGMFRFDYLHSPSNMADNTGFLGFFDITCDPMRRMTELAMLTLFRRGDLKRIEPTCALVLDEASMKGDYAVLGPFPKWEDAAWRLRVGTTVPGHEGDFRAVSAESCFMSECPPVSGSSMTSVTVDKEKKVFSVVTDRTAGAFAYATSGRVVCGPLAFSLDVRSATVWASSLDEKPIRTSSRLLVCHLTDMQGRNTRFRKDDFDIIEGFGEQDTMTLARCGSAWVELALDNPSGYRVYALKVNGMRIAEMPVTATDKVLRFNAMVRGAGGQAVLAYEVVRK